MISHLINWFASVSVVITGLGPDFTRLESFGKVDAFAETLVRYSVSDFVVLEEKPLQHC